MIRYALSCAAGHEFDGWFPDSSGCDIQLERHLVTCPDCGSVKVRKALMAPAVRTGSRDASAKRQALALATHQAKLEALRAHVEQNFENVGDRFPEEARRIHYGETEARDIVGEASLDEAKSLIEEGVEVAPLPIRPRTDA